MNVRHNTLAMTGDLFNALPGAHFLVGRPIVTADDLTILARSATDVEPSDLDPDDIVVPIGADGLVVAGSSGATAFHGVLPRPEKGERAELHAVRVVDHRIRLFLAGAVADADADPSVFDRQVRAFGAPGQRLLRQLRVGVVGAGGTGSSVCEQLIRLGVGTIVSIDDQTISDDGSNVTRVYGSTMHDINVPKVDIVQRTASLVGFGTTVVTTQGTINDRETARLLRHCDVVFGCTDDNRGRVVLSRLAYWYLIPVIDMGVQLDSDGGTLRSIDGRITVVGPGMPCLQCRGRINQAALHAETLPPEERAARVGEQYAIGLAEPDPAVIAYTTTVSALAVAELLNRLFGIDAEPGPSETLVQFHFRRMAPNRREPHPGHWCTDSQNLGVGDTGLFLGVTWAS